MSLRRRFFAGKVKMTSGWVYHILLRNYLGVVAGAPRSFGHVTNQPLETARRNALSGYHPPNKSVGLVG